MRKANIKPDRVDLWTFRWETRRLVLRYAAAAILDKDPYLAQAQSVFFPYLKGYVEFRGRYKEASADLQDANPNDPLAGA